MAAWYSAALTEFLATDPETIVGILSTAASDRRLAPAPESTAAWRGTVNGLRRAALAWLKSAADSTDWKILLEYELPRRSRRIDVIILARDIITLIEFKVGATNFGRDARWQTEQYCLDIRDFHAKSLGRRIVPFLVATSAKSSLPAVGQNGSSDIAALNCVNFEGLASRLPTLVSKYSLPGVLGIDGSDWEHSAYRPTPWIVEAAQDIYRHNDVREIQLAGSHNLDKTVDAVLELIETCRSSNRHGIAFITGAPGSGKTLAGLQVVHSPRIAQRQSEATGIFLSGNRPLVEVIRGALAVGREQRARNGSTPRERARTSETFIQHAYLFRDFHAKDPSNIPPEHVILFDEAQRAWNADQVIRKTRGVLVKSEPALFLEIMARVPRWSVIIAVVGSGQEINTGEAGLGEWGDALLASKTDWVVRVSPRVMSGMINTPGDPLFQNIDGVAEPTEDPRLHLEMNVRSPRAESLNLWVDALIDLKISEANRHFGSIVDFPIVMTRELADARAWLKDRTDEDHRCGLVANATARRLRAWGLDTNALRNDASWANWFLKPHGDIRSSNQLEVPATNFDCQGLELDWVGMCWGSDLTYDLHQAQWKTRRMRGANWQEARNEARKFMLNSYRVLLTRARQGMVIWIPNPTGDDPTLDPALLDATANLLKTAGVPYLT